MTSIIIPVYNQWKLTAKCLESIWRYTPGESYADGESDDHEIIIVDNGSTDGTAAELRSFGLDEHSTYVRVLTNATNRGYPAAINQGLAVAKGETLCLLNNDTEVTEGWLSAMLGCMDHHFMVGPVSDHVSGWQGGYDAAFEHPLMKVQRLVGFCLLMKRAVVDAIGGFDTRFGLGNFDDDDYCLRAILAGFQLAICPSAFVHHVGGATFRAEGIDYGELMAKNWVLFKEKWGIPAEVQMGANYTFFLDPDRNVYVPLEVPASTH